jgi:rubrerythrin
MGDGWNIAAFAVGDLYEMAAIVEQGGFDFYARCIARSQDPRVRNELLFLRNEEAGHKAFFLEQLRKQGGSPKGAVSAGLHELLEREFLGPMERVYSSGDISDNDKTLAFGAALEQKSIDFYAALRGRVESGLTADIDRIISQEEAHKRKLELIRAY